MAASGLHTPDAIGLNVRECLSSDKCPPFRARVDTLVQTKTFTGVEHERIMPSRGNGCDEAFDSVEAQGAD